MEPHETPPTELDELDPEGASPRQIKLGSDVFELSPLRTRQFLRLMRIITYGAAPLLEELVMAKDDTDEEFIAKFLGVVIFAMPNAENETIAFLQSMCLIPDSVTDANERARMFRQHLDEPEIDTTMEIIEAIVEENAEDLKSLGKRLKSLLGVAQKANQIKPTRRTTAKKARSRRS